jgi:uncharacterized protein YgiM (DUF1202 family)
MYSILLFSLVTSFLTPLSSYYLPHKSSARLTESKISSDYDCYIIGTGVRMRETPSLQGKIISSFQDGETVDLLKVNSDGKWFRVRKKSGKAGWVYSQYVECPGCK